MKIDIDDEVSRLETAFVALSGIPDYAGRIRALDWLRMRIVDDERRRTLALRDGDDAAAKEPRR